MLLHSVSQQWAGTLAGADKEYYMQVLGKLPCKKKGNKSDQIWPMAISSLVSIWTWVQFSKWGLWVHIVYTQK